MAEFLPTPNSRRPSHRIAAFVGNVFPLAEPRTPSAEGDAYGRLHALAEALDAELRVVHGCGGSPEGLSHELRARFGTGLLIPPDPGICCNDVEHLRACLPAAFDELAAAFAGMVDDSVPAVIASEAFQRAASTTRWLRGWAPDLIISLGLGESSIHATIASRLLSVPRLTVLDAAAVDSAPHSVATDVHQAQAVLVADSLAATAVAEVSGHNPATVFVMAANGSPPSELAAHLRQLCAASSRRAAAAIAGAAPPQLGPKAAFRTRVSPGLKLPARCRPFVLIGAERTGTTMLQSMLAQQTRVHAMGELFNPRSIAKDILALPARREPSEPNESSDLSAQQSQRRSELLALRKANPAALIERAVTEAIAAEPGSGTVWAGFKLLYYHGLVDDRILDALAATPELVVIHLRRHDRLARCISMARADASDRWIAKRGPENGASKNAHRAEPVPVDGRAMLEEFGRIEQFESRYDALFAEHTVLQVRYEDLLREPTEQLRRIAATLGFEPREVEPTSRKMRSDDVGEDVDDLAALKDALRGTRWQDLTPGRLAKPKNEP
ncbi:MAG: Stf0 family sulfotransferase [Planctomycetota bacterium]